MVLLLASTIYGGRFLSLSFGIDERRGEGKRSCGCIVASRGLDVIVVAAIALLIEVALWVCAASILLCGVARVVANATWLVDR